MAPSRPARLVVLALLCLAGSGLTAPARGAPVAPVWDQPVIVDEDPVHSAAEPSLSVSPDGVIYITAPTGLLGLGLREPIPPPVGGRGGDLAWRSDDGGRTWKYLSTYDRTFGGGDADVVAGPGDTVYASGLYLACVSVARSGDRGETWVNVPVGCANSPIDDRQWNGLAPDGALYTAFGSTSAGSIVVNRSLVSDPAVVPGPNLEISDGDYQWVGVLAVDPSEGGVYVAWNTNGSPNDCDVQECAASTEEPDEIKVAVLEPGDFNGGSVTAPEPKLVATRRFDTFDAFVGVDVDPTGRAYVVWNERHPEVGETWSMLATSDDDGETWSEPVKVNQAPTTAFPWVTAGDDGRVAVTYYGTAARGRSPETVDGDWRVYSAYSADAGRTWVETVATPDPVHQGAVCTSGTGCGSGTRDLLDFFETGIDPDGCLVATYTDNSRDEVVAGTRSDNQPELVAFVRQSGGPGLRAGKTCATAGTPTGPTGPTAQPRPNPPTAAPAPPSPPARRPGTALPSTGLPGVLPIAAAAVLLAAAAAGRGRPENHR